MKQKVILISLLIIVVSSCFIPVSQQKTVIIKSSLLNVYRLLASPVTWEQWRPDLRKTFLADSGKISVQKEPESFTLKYQDQDLLVKQNETVFSISDKKNNKTIDYTYTLMPDHFQQAVLDTHPKKTLLIVDRKTSLIKYLFGKISGNQFADTYADDFKNFVETDSLLYGFKVFKTKVPEANLVEIKQAVLTKDKFSAAAKMLIKLQEYIRKENAKQMYPVIAQFIPQVKDSVQVNIGFFINKEVKSGKDIFFARMPKGGPLYCAKFSGQFNQRQKAYIALHQYYNDHLYQSAILPFETYLDNKLPDSDTSHVNIQVNFSNFF